MAADGGTAQTSGKAKKKAKCKAKAWRPADGQYDGGDLEVVFSGGASKASIVFAGGGDTCVPLVLSTSEGRTTITAAKLTVTPPEVVVDHLPALGMTMKVALTVKPNLSYVAVIDSTTQAEGGVPCRKQGVRISGKLTKR